MQVLATAGHVDHGKSAIVAVLSGSNPDRLKEEQIREMTIDLGFAWFTLPNGNEIGIVDVPGHIDFIENMLAGMGGIDAVLLIVAADEGMMPQTREHLAIIDLLEIKNGIVILNKIDLVNDPEWLNLIEDEVRKEISTTSLVSAPIIRFSAQTKQGLDDLLQAIQEIENDTQVNKNNHTPRLPIDRVFSLQGFGTIVTGTLLDGSFEVGEEIEILPHEKRSRIRGLQTHKKKIQTAQPGSRTAVNLVGVTTDEIHRGDVLARLGQFKPTSRIDVNIRLVNDPGVTLKHNDLVKLFVGTAQRNARVRLLGATKLITGDTGFLQIETDQPICVKNGDHFIIRKASPSTTLGGGKILETNPIRRYRLNDTLIIEGLRLKQMGTPRDLVLEKLNRPLKLGLLQKNLLIEENELKNLVKLLIEAKEIVALPKNLKIEANKYLMKTDAWDQLLHRVIQILQSQHTLHPFRVGFRAEEIQHQLRTEDIPINIIAAQMEELGLIEMTNELLHLPDHTPKLSPLQEKNKAKMWSLIDQNRFSPPSTLEFIEILGADLFKALVENNELICVSEDVVFRQVEFNSMMSYVDSSLTSGNPITVSTFRDQFHTSRKYALGFLEFLDQKKITRREGDGRVRY